jgi:hypothetical protein
MTRWRPLRNFGGTWCLAIHAECLPGNGCPGVCAENYYPEKYRTAADAIPESNDLERLESAPEM